MPLTRNRVRTSSARGYTGKVPAHVWDLLGLAWEVGVAVSSNTAREYAPEVALAASLGWISTVSLDGKRYLRVWNVTAEGVSALNHREML